MAYEIPGTTITLEAAGDLSAAQYKFVKIDGNGQVAVCTANTDQPIGILQDKPAAQGRVAQVMVDGISKLSSDAPLALGNKVGTSADGQGAAYAHGSDTTKYIVGTVIKASSAANGYATVLFSCMAPNRGA